MNWWNLTAKAAGLTTLYYGIKDINRIGLANKNKNPQTNIAKNYTDMYIKSNRLDLNETFFPTVVSNAKKGWVNTYLEDSIMPFVWGVTGYTKGIAMGTALNAIPMALGIGALTLSASDKFDKATGRNLTNYSFMRKHGGKFCLALLALGAVKSFLYNICNVGKYDQI